MPDNQVTHEMLRAGQLALIDRFDRHEQQFRETTNKLFEKVDRAIEIAQDNRVHITETQMHVNAITEARAANLARFEEVAGKVAMLEGEHHERKGERGVLAVIAKSPFIAWLFAAVGALWAFLKSGQGSAGQ